MKQTLRAITSSLCLLAATGAGATIHTINVSSNVFTPSSLTASLGDTIRWVWQNGSHTTTSTTIPTGAAAWNAVSNNTNPVFQYVPAVAGTYNYICQPHQALGMVGTFTVTCSAPSQPAITSPSGNVVCPGGSINLTTPAVAGATYEWRQGTTLLSSTTNTQSVTAAGSYTVKITTGCGNATSAAFQVTAGTAPTITITQSSANLCQGNCDTLTAPGGNIYQWPTMAGLTPMGSFAVFCASTTQSTGAQVITLSGTNLQGCTGTASATVNVLKTPVPNFTHSHSGQAYTFTNTTTDTNSTGNTWSWNFGDASPASTQKNPSHTYAAPGNYNVTLMVTSGNSCQKSVSKQIVTTGIGKLSILGNVSLSPNPATETVRLSGLESGLITICDYTGKPLQQITVTGRNTSFSVANLPAGIYLVRVQSNGLLATERLSVIH